MSQPTVSRTFDVFIFVILLTLTGVTVGAAYINLGPLNPIVALTIATIKAVLVVLFFMHVKHTSEHMTKVVIISAVFWLLLLLTLSLADYATRPWS